MCNDEIVIHILAAHLRSDPPCHGFVIERMKPARFFYIRHSGDPRFRDHLIYRYRIYYKRRFADFVRNIFSEHCTQIGGMLTVYRIFEVIYHRIIYRVGSARDRLHQAASADHAVERIYRMTCFIKGRYYEIFPIFVLIENSRKHFQILTRVSDILFEHLFCVLKHRNFRRCTARIYH